MPINPPNFPRHVFTPQSEQSYHHLIQDGPCFICEMLSRNPAYRHHVIYRDETAVVFLNKYPTLYAYVLVAPVQHREQVSGDFDLGGYLALQTVIWRASEAIRRVVTCERMYILSLGSQQANRHIHWHVAPLPPGVPFDEQQLAALSFRRGVLQIPEDHLADLAQRIRAEMDLL